MRRNRTEDAVGLATHDLTWSDRSLNIVVAVVGDSATAAIHRLMDCSHDMIAVHARKIEASCPLSEPAVRRMQHFAAYWLCFRRFLEHQHCYPSPRTQSNTDLWGAGATTSGM